MDSNRLQLAMSGAESSYGTLAAGALQILRYTGESIAQVSQNLNSAEIRDDRQISRNTRTTLNVAGDINFELSYGSQDTLLQYALQSAAWSTASAAGVFTSTPTITTGSVLDGFASGAVAAAGGAVGGWIQLSGFTSSYVTNNAGINGLHKITAMTDTTVTLAPALVDTAADVGGSGSAAWVIPAQITNGVALNTFQLEKKYTNLSNIFAKYTGCGVNGFSLNWAIDQITNGSFSVLGKVETSETATIGSSYTNPNTNEVFNNIEDLDYVYEGTSYAVTPTSRVGLTVANSLRTRQNLGEASPTSLGVGTFVVSGTRQAYFQTVADMNKFLNQTTSALAIAMQDTAGNKYILDIPRIKYTSGRRVAGGQNQDIIADLAFSAYRHPTEGITMRIVRAPAA